MTKETQRAELHKTIWRIANDLRGSVDGWDFKQYVLGMLFYRFISENLAAYLNEHERKAGNASFDYADLSDIEAEFGRARKLLATRAASRSLYDQRDNARKVALAAVEAAEAALSEAELALDRAYVKAPIAGRVSRPEVTLGNLVGAADGQVLTSIVSADGIYADFQIDEQTYIRMVRGGEGDLRAGGGRGPVLRADRARHR